jgi:hypothetical protein
VRYYREKMRKHQAVIRLNNSQNSDMSTLDLSAASRLEGEGGGEGAEHLLDSTNIYYTLDTRRLANKQKKSLRER